jgi:hypothetical protein
MNIRQEIIRMKYSGYSMNDIYIYVKDYVCMDQFLDIYEAE